MALRVETFEAGPIQTNAYLVADDATGDAIVIDAPREGTGPVTAAAAAAGWRIDRIVITHAHWDHIADAAAMKAATNAPLAAHPLAAERMASPGSKVFDLDFTIPPTRPDELLDDGDTVTVGGHTFQVLHLPGHDPAHIALYSKDDRVFLGGDVLFPGGHGTTEIPGADQAAMNRSIARLVALPPDVKVYPGHGLPTTTGAELGWMRGLGR